MLNSVPTFLVLVLGGVLPAAAMPAGAKPATAMPVQQDTRPREATRQQEPIPGIGPIGKVQRLHTGFRFTEGPAADRKGNCYFTDIPNNKIHRIDADGKLSTFMENSQGINGLMFDNRGRLFACQGGARRVVRIDVRTKRVTSFTSSFRGERFNRPNDISLDTHGGAYFTDPMFGRRRRRGAGRGGEQERPAEPVQGVYYADRKGRVTRLADDLTRPNGILLAPGGKTLYVLPSAPGGLIAFDVKAPGRVQNRRQLYKATGGDGMTVDRQGNLYLTQGSAIVVVNKKGRKLGAIQIPERPSNVTFAGPNFDRLVVTARTSVYVARMRVRGHAVCLAPRQL